MSALEHQVEDLLELVDGQEEWSHRKRLHSIESTLRGSELVHTARKELAALRSRRLRDNATLVLAVVAIVINLFHH